MLLPSDVARLVLGYLQEEGLTATSQAFIHESPNLKEYAEHTTADGTIPACVFSLFGKSLTTILNEYVAAKTKESCPEVPAVMTSLWKKLDFTLNQIKSLQNSPAISACQRTRSRIGLANMARQRVLTIASAGAVVCSSVSEANPIFSPVHTSNCMLGHSTPVSYTALHTRLSSGSGLNQQIHDGSRLLNTPRESPVQISVCEHRLNPGPMSPGRRKWDTPRKRSGGLSAPSCPSRSATAVSSVSAEPQPDEVVDENFPQLVIQNARDKILGDRSLQEKLAENINKILANEPTPQTSKASSATMEPDQSIDEILGLQGEIHMSDDAIHDILEQTESDPAFQALFDLFDYNKSKFPDGEPGDGEMSSCQEASEAAGSSATVSPPQSNDPGTTQRDTNVSDTTSMTVKTRAGQDRKTRKSTGPTLLKKTVIVPSGRTSRIENSSAKLLVSHGDNRGASPAPGNSNKKERASLFNTAVGVTPMNIDEPLITPPPLSDSMDAQEPATSTTKTVFESATVSSSRASTAFVASAVTTASNVDRKQDSKGIQGSIEQLATAPSSALSNQPAFFSPVQVELSNTVMPTADLSHVPVSSGAGVTQPMFTHSLTPECATSASSSVPLRAVLASSTTSTVAPFTSTAGLPTSAAVAPVTLPAPSASSTPASFSSCTPVSVAPDSSFTNRSTPNKAAADPNNIVSLKIIISDNQEEDTPSDPALNQAISSISGDKIPTIYLSSPAKSPGAPGTPKTNLDEAAQAVSGLQSSEAQASPLSCKAGALVASPLTGTSQAQQSYIIHLPLDAANPPLPGATASYFLVTEPPNTDTQSRQVLLPAAAAAASASKGQPLPPNQFGVKTPTHSQGFSSGSTLILPSPVKPMMLPISVMGQNTLGNVQMVSSQLVAIPSSVPVQQSETVKPPTVTIKQSTTAGTEENVVHKVIPPVSAENSQQDAAKGSGHRRILCFESSSEVQPQTSKTQTTTPSVKNTSTLQPVQQPEKEKSQLAPRTKPAILGGNKPKRRVEIVRCSADPQTAGGLQNEAEKSTPQQQKDPVKRNSRKQDHNIHKQESQSEKTSKLHSSQPATLKKSETGQRSQSTDRKHNHDKSNDEAKVIERRSLRLSSDSTLKSGTRKEKDESNKKEPAEKAPARSREARTEKRAPSQETPSVTANKENEMKGSMQEQQQQSTPSSDISPPAATQPMSNSQSKAAKPPSKTSSLAKQAAEMLQDIQGINSPSTPVKRPGAGSSDISLPQTPGTGCNQEESTNSPRTPSRQKKGKNGEGTPKRLMPPNTPDAPTCSPASEAGSENSINMAAHTLMILSRAAIARTGTPLKDSLRQDEVGEKMPTSSKSSKKRKQSSPTDSPPAKKESKRSPSKKKDREKKKLMDCFPHDLDVDKFLSSLHYDE